MDKQLISSVPKGEHHGVDDGELDEAMESMHHVDVDFTVHHLVVKLILKITIK